MKAVIPCAKKEESLFPFIESKPTALMPVAGKPIIKHMIADLQDIGVDDIYIVTNYLEDKFFEEFDEFTNVNLITQEELNGTGGAVEACNFIEDDFLVVNGDVIASKDDIGSLIDKHENKDSDVTVLATEERKPEKFGVFSIENDRITSLEEKPEDPENTLVNTGIYVFTPEIFSKLEEMEGEKSLADAVGGMIEEKDGRFEFVSDYWIDIGSPKKLWKADQVKREYLIDETDISDDAEVHETAVIDGKARIEKDVEIKPNTVIEGKVFIGEGSVIGPNTTVRDSSINSYSQLRACDLESSVLFEKNVMDPSTFVENCIIGEDSEVKSGS
ncbi:MAG: sugar phosphate nucleotidyltransferase, partial [Candidatus Nanohaloarchaea archaeon]